MTDQKKLLTRAVIGGFTAAGVLLIVILLLNGIRFSAHGNPVSHFSFASHGTIQLFGSYALAVVMEFICIFALGAAIGISTMPFADDTHSLIKESAIHFILTGLLVLLNGWVQCLLEWVWALLLVPYTLLYLFIWFGRWIGWYMDVDQIKIKLGLAPAHSPLKWRETLPYLPFLVVLCILLPIVLVWVDRVALYTPVLSGLLMPYLIFPVVSLCSGISLGKRQGLCILYPVAAYLLYIPIVFWLFNYTALFHADLLFTFALIGNIAGAIYRKRKNKEVSHETNPTL